MGSWGVAELSGGALTGFDYHSYTFWPGASGGSLVSGYDQANFRPPPGWDRYEVAPGVFADRDGWWAQDADVYPDFPTTARVIEAFMSLGQQPVDGVVALDVYGMQRLLAAIGPVQVPEYGETITAGNVIERADFYEGRGPALLKPTTEKLDKAFLAALAAALLDRVKALDVTQLARAAAALGEAAREKHFLVAVHDPTLGALLQRQGLDGSVYAGPGDYLMIVDQNTIYTKISSHVTSSAAYTVRIQPDLSAEAELRLTYHNTQRALDPRVGFTSDFRDYARVYVPLGAALESAGGVDGSATTFSEDGHTVFGAFVYVPSGQTRTAVFRYRLPASIFSRDLGPEYRLMVQKQPGAIAVDLKATVMFPDGVTASAGGIPGAVAAGGSVTFGGSYRADTDFRLPAKGLPASLPPGAAPVDQPYSGDRAETVRNIPEVAAILRQAGTRPALRTP